MSDDDGLDAIGSTRTMTLFSGNAHPIMDAEVIESEPHRTDLSPRSNAERDRADHRAYTLSDFE